MQYNKRKKTTKTQQPTRASLRPSTHLGLKGTGELILMVIRAGKQQRQEVKIKKTKDVTFKIKQEVPSKKNRKKTEKSKDFISKAFSLTCSKTQHQVASYGSTQSTSKCVWVLQLLSDLYNTECKPLSVNGLKVKPQQYFDLLHS